jgi:hypothetical protein
MCHYRHRAHADPLILPACRTSPRMSISPRSPRPRPRTGCRSRAIRRRPISCSRSGLQEIGATLGRLPAVERMRLAQQIRRLTLPGEMGEKFKAIALTRGVEIPLSGFSLRDERGRLSRNGRKSAEGFRPAACRSAW